MATATQLRDDNKGDVNKPSLFRAYQAQLMVLRYTQQAGMGYAPPLGKRNTIIIVPLFPLNKIFSELQAASIII